MRGANTIEPSFYSPSKPSGKSPWSGGGANTSSSSVAINSLPPLAAKKDRCNCSHTPLTPSLSRSKAFRDSRKDIALSGATLKSSSVETSNSIDSFNCVKNNTSSSGYGSSSMLEDASSGSAESTERVTSYELLPDRLDVKSANSPSSSGKSKKAFKIANSKYSPKKVISVKLKHSPKKKKSPRSVPASPSSSLHTSPRHHVKENSSLQSLVNSGKIKAKRPNRKERLRRHKRAHLVAPHTNLEGSGGASSLGIWEVKSDSSLSSSRKSSATNEFLLGTKRFDESSPRKRKVSVYSAEEGKAFSSSDCTPKSSDNFSGPTHASHSSEELLLATDEKVSILAAWLLSIISYY